MMVVNLRDGNAWIGEVFNLKILNKIIAPLRRESKFNLSLSYNQSYFFCLYIIIN